MLLHSIFVDEAFFSKHPVFLDENAKQKYIIEIEPWAYIYALFYQSVN